MMLITFLTTILVAQSLSIDNRQQQQQISRSIKASERRAKVRTVNARPTCPRCARPPSVCVCDALPARAIATKTKLLVLQHPNEFRRRHFSTVPLLPLCRLLRLLPLALALLGLSPRLARDPLVSLARAQLAGVGGRGAAAHARATARVALAFKSSSNGGADEGSSRDVPQVEKLQLDPVTVCYIPCMTDIHLHIMCSHYRLSGNAPV